MNTGMSVSVCVVGEGGTLGVGGSQRQPETNKERESERGLHTDKNKAARRGWGLCCEVEAGSLVLVAVEIAGRVILFIESAASCKSWSERTLRE